MIAGSNCALVIAAMNAAVRAAGGGRRTRAAVSVLALGGFVLVVGPDPSVQRAAIMAAVLLVSRFGGRAGHALPALGAATLVLLWADPWQAIQPGFALSVSATLGILLAASPVTDRLRLRLRLPPALALPLAVAAAAQLSCAPLLLLLQPGLSLGGVVANVLASPAAPVGTGLGLAALVVLPLCGKLGSVLVELAVWPARWIAAAGNVGVSLPGARLFWPEGWRGALSLSLALALIGGAIVLGRRAGLARGRLRGARRGGTSWVRIAVPSRGLLGVARTLMAAGAGLILGVTAVVPGTVRLGTPHDWVVVACDVGQGDAVMLRDPGSPGDVMLIDTGDDEESLVACLDLFGVDRISLLVLTHNHWDHTGALEALVGRVDRAILPKESVDDVGKAGEAQLRERLSRLGVPASEGYRGMNGSSGGLSWRVLGPPERSSYRDANATSLVVSAEVAGHTVLLLGDTGADEQRQLEDLEASAKGPAIRADIVKVAHHGSKNQLDGFYERLGSAIALVSVGEGNRYGHPNAALVGRLEAAGTRVLRTDELGSIAVSIRGGAPEPWAAGERSTVVRATGRRGLAISTGRVAGAMTTRHIADANAPVR
ncbi:ComEC/Rec2-related protein [Leucobacter komagatae]|uniref:ComEC/Rec2-related protein n=1 Tax=Leucobacter komagatae TaxID=55969 RepID=A0A542Y3R8_9MICO|nr:ComEC/Rec2 family competence protein [Leucobacter komagatae]TQL42710.1 ComEC/Rec2-related protein [Leucobacter komagatae]